MIRPKQVFLAVEPVDMRWGMERLSCHVQHHLAQPPSEGSARGFTFTMKVLSFRSNHVRGRWGGGMLTTYLRFVIERIADYRINKLDALLPWHVADQIAKTKITADA